MAFRQVFPGARRALSATPVGDLTPAEIRSTVAAWSATHLRPARAAALKAAAVPPPAAGSASPPSSSTGLPTSLWRDLGGLGVLGITAPPSVGGLGLGYAHHVAAMEALSRGWPAAGLSYGAHSNLCVNQLVRHASASASAAYLPSLVDGSAVGGLAMSEPGAGSDVLGMTTSAVRGARASDGAAGWILNGAKAWCTNAPLADVLVVYAVTHPEAATKGGRLTAFVVETASPGLSVGPPLAKIGMTASPTADVILEDVWVPESAVLGTPGEGVAVLMSGLNSERLVLAAGPLGIMEAALDVVVPYVRERTQFGAPIGSFGLMRGKVADMITATAVTRAHVYAVAAQMDVEGEEGAAVQGGDGRGGGRADGDGDGGGGGRRRRRMNMEAASVILAAAEAAVAVTGEAVQALGGNGYCIEYGVGGLGADAKLYTIGAGTSEIRRTLVGKAGGDDAVWGR
ncbi:hypothetical protein MMPV_008396 [Pyropia vietnamensis]